MSKMRYRLIGLSSFLPEKVIRLLSKKFDTPDAFLIPELGSAFWMEADYHKYVRRDKREHIHETD